MIKLILIGIAAIVLVILVIAALRPGAFKVTRGTTVSAPAPEVFGYINDLHQFQLWSPWAKMDPNAKTSFEGPPAGQGAVFHWEGKSTGAGTMTNIGNKPDESVDYRLDFRKPFEGTNMVRFDIQPEGNQTRVTWSMTGNYNFVMKVMGLFMNCDKMCGDQFEQGLANLKTVTEERTAAN